MIMPFGKHKGKSVADLPQTYCQWLWANTKLFGDLKDEIGRRLGYIKDEDVEFEFKFHETDETYEDSSTEEFVELVEKSYRDLSRKWHPDHGGSHDGMKAINAYYETLKERMKELKV